MKSKHLAAVICLGFGVGCASPPTAPTVGDSNRRPVNSTEAIQLQSCRSELKNTKLLLDETAKLSNAASVALANVAARCPQPGADQGSSAEDGVESGVRFVPSSFNQSPPAPSTVYVLLFPFGSTQIDLTEDSAMTLASSAASAAFVVIRGRTDGLSDNKGNQRVAQGRAEAVRSYLTALGVDPTRIRSTYQSVGDYAADNASERGRALNRRAEIEIYMTPPRRELLSTKLEGI